jgi:hypothetical protein
VDPADPPKAEIAGLIYKYLEKYSLQLTIKPVICITGLPDAVKDTEI